MKRNLFLLFVLCTAIRVLGQTQSTDSVIVGKFNYIPLEYDGSVICFSLSSEDLHNESYVMVNNMGDEMYALLDNKAQHLTLQEKSEDKFVYKNELYKINIFIVDCDWDITIKGYAIIERLDKKKRTSRINYIAECTI